MKVWLKKTVRFCLQTLLFPLEWFHSFCDWMAITLLKFFKPTEYERHGACKMTGQCCQAIAMQIPKTARKHPWIRKVFLIWHDVRYNFECVGQDGDYLIYSCRYLQPNNTCGIQKVKPKLCRDFPQTLWFGKRGLHKGCGFYFAKRGEVPFRQILEQKEKS